MDEGACDWWVSEEEKEKRSDNSSSATYTRDARDTHGCAGNRLRYFSSRLSFPTSLPIFLLFLAFIQLLSTVLLSSAPVFLVDFSCSRTTIFADHVSHYSADILFP